MAQFVKLVPENLKALREVNPRLMSYNVEFAEVTGGTFWKAYTPEQVAGTEDSMSLRAKTALLQCTRI